jgi:hypothetical protein
LRIVNDEVFVLCRDQLMRLRDLNGDGEADFYECFNNDTWVSPSYHAFAFDLQTDRAGNFYYTRCGQRVDPVLPLNGGMVKVFGLLAAVSGSLLRPSRGGWFASCRRLHLSTNMSGPPAGLTISKRTH